MYITSISTKEYFFPKSYNKISFHANPIIDTFEKTSKQISCAEIKDLISSYLKKNKNISKELTNISDYQLNIKQKLLKTITNNREDYFFGDNPICDIDNISLNSN